jgi:glutathione S-transferase
MSGLALPLLFSFRRCPYAIRARIAIASAQVDVQVCEVALRDKPPAMLALSPKGTVPVLQLPDGRVLDESIDIMFWALQQNDAQSWLRGTSDDAVLARQWAARCDTAFKPLLDRYKYANRHPEWSPIEHRQRALDGFVQALDTRLQGRRHLLGDAPCWADAAMFPFVRQFAMVEPAWFEQEALPDVRRWLATWVEGDLFRQVMVRQETAAESSAARTIAGW